MIYKGQFNNVDDQLISVYIGTSGADILNIANQQVTTLLLTDNPVTINSESEGLFTPIKANSCTIRLLTNTIYEDIYSSTAQGSPVLVKNEDTILFYGYTTPNIYTQDYVGLDNLEIEAISALSTLKYFKFSGINRNTYTCWYDLIKACLTKAGYYSKFYFPDNFNYENRTDLREPLLKVLHQFEQNFYDDDEEKTPWTYEDILTEFCKFMGVSLVIHNAEIYFIDYEYTGSSYYLYNLTNDSVSKVTLSDSYTITADSYKETGATISFDETYNKISIKDNLFEVEDVIPDLMENLVNQNTDSNKHYESTTVIDDKNYTLINAFFKSNQWYNYQGKLATDGSGNIIIESPEITPDSISSLWSASFWQKVADYPTEEEPSALDWTTYFTMYNNGVINTSRYICQTYPINDINLICNGGYFILNMDYKLSGDYKANNCLKSSSQTYSATSYGTGFNDTLFPCRLYIGDYYYDGEGWVHKREYQRKLNKGYYADTTQLQEETRKPTPTWYKYKDSEGDWKFTNNKAVWDAATTEKKSGTYKSWQHVYFIGSASSTYDDGTRIYIDEDYYHECVLQDRFYLAHKNKEGDKIFDEVKSLTNTVSWRMNIADSQDGIAIKLPNFLLNGKLRFELFGSNELGTYPNYLTNGSSILCKAVHVKTLQLLYKASDNVVSIFDNSVNTEDVIYTNVINDGYINEWSDLEIRVTTQLDNRVTSYSSIILKTLSSDTATFCYNILDKQLGKYQIQENNLVEKYFNHYHSPKIILNASLENKLKPYTKVKERLMNKTLNLDSYELDLRNDILRVKLIEY